MARVIRDHGRVVPGPVVDARMQARAIVEEAQAQAAALAREATAEASELRARAEREGREAGEARAAALVIEAERRHAQSLDESERELLRLGVGLAERILRKQIELAPERVRDIAAGVLERARRARRRRLHLHPEDVPLLRDLIAPADLTELVADASIERGGCLLESDLGTLDGRLEVQVAELRRALLGERS